MNGPRVAALVAVGLIAGGAGYVLSQYTSGPAPESATVTVAEAEAARTVPAFSLIDVEGNMRDGSEWSGQVRLVNFWATWCPPCRREIPLLIELQEEHAGKLQVIGIAIDDLDDVQAYAADAGFNYPVLVGQQEAVDLGNAFLKDFVGLPFTVIANAENEIIRVHVGELHREQAEAFLGEVL